MKLPLFEILLQTDDSGLYAMLTEGALEQFVPGLARLSACDQGTRHHLEGSAGKHTAMVVDKLKILKNLDLTITFDEIDLLSGLIHDLEKPSTRFQDEFGVVTFPGHEAKAALRIPEIAERLGLQPVEQDKLHYLVANHGKAHFLPSLESETVLELSSSPFWSNLKLLQRADAESCYFDKEGTKFLPVHWDLFDMISRERSKA